MEPTIETRAASDINKASPIAKKVANTGTHCKFEWWRGKRPYVVMVPTEWHSEAMQALREKRERLGVWADADAA